MYQRNINISLRRCPQKYTEIMNVEYVFTNAVNENLFSNMFSPLPPSELSEVLWNMVFQLGIGVAVFSGPFFGAIAVFFLFAVWAGTCMYSAMTHFHKYIFGSAIILYLPIG